MSRSTHYVVTVLSSYTPYIVADCNVLPFPYERIQISAPALPRLSQSFTTIMAPQLPWSDEMISTFLNLVISKGVHVLMMSNLF